MSIRYVSLFVSLFASISFAQTSVNTTKMNTFTKPSDSDASGFRLGYSRPLYSAGTDVTFNSPGLTADTGTLSVDHANVLTFGYAYLPVRSLGYIADFNYMEVRVDGRSANLVRLQGSGAIAINPMINFHAGLNVADLVSKGASQWDRGALGVQAGLGIQLTRRFAFEVNYSETNLTSHQSFEGAMPGLTANIDLKVRGYDLSFLGTF